MLYSAYFLETLNAYDDFHSETTHPARLLSWFLAYFGEYFEMDKMAIIFMKEDMPLVMLKSYLSLPIDNTPEKPVLCVFDPLDANNNTTLRTFEASSLRIVFSQTKETIFKEYIRIYNSEENIQNITILDKII